MTYTPNEEWTSSTAITSAKLDNLETQYTESAAYLASHEHDTLYYTQAQMQAAYWYAGNDGSGSGSDADLIYKSTGNLHAASFYGLGVPAGLIIMWSGESVPSGWLLCDGNNGTRDLRGRFVECAGTDAVGTTGTGSHAPAGSITVGGHSLTTAEVAGHTHTYQDKYGTGGKSYWGGTESAKPYAVITSETRTTGNSSAGKATADAHNHTGSFTGDNASFLQPYYALAFIQKT